jgi:capsular polysaccharide biosynthesis protein
MPTVTCDPTIPVSIAFIVGLIIGVMLQVLLVWFDRQRHKTR